MTRRHSTVFDVHDIIAEAIADADWPTHGDTLARPDVGFGLDESPDRADERVQVVDHVEDDASIEWARFSPGGRDERFLVDIVIDSTVPGQSRVAARARIRELAEVVQGVFYTPDPPDYDPPTAPDWWLPIGGVSRVTYQIWHDGEGWVGQSVVTVAVATRI